MEKKGLRPFRFIKSPAGEGRSYAEGAQRDSNAIPLRVPASRWSMADMVSFCLRTLFPISRAAKRKM